MKKKISPKDLEVWRKFLSSNKPVENKDIDLEQELEIKTDIKKIDLHGYSLNEANKEIKKKVLSCYKQNINKILVITGKGLRSKNEKNPFVSKDLSLLKYSIPDYLNTDLDLKNIINSMSPANIKEGGEGAFYIYLKKFKG